MTDIDIVDELRAAAVGWRTPIFLNAAAEIERLRGEGDWEYGVSWVDVAGRIHMPTDTAWRARAEVRRMNTGDPYPEDNYVVRRRKAGPWERVPEGESDDA